MDSQLRKSIIRRSSEHQKQRGVYLPKHVVLKTLFRSCESIRSKNYTCNSSESISNHTGIRGGVHEYMHIPDDDKRFRSSVLLSFRIHGQVTGIASSRRRGYTCTAETTPQKFTSGPLQLGQIGRSWGFRRKGCVK